MKRIEFSRYGDASVMRLGDFEPPPPGPQEVRVRVVCAAVNPIDWKQRQGLMKLFMTRRFPKGMGSDFAGIVDAVGAQVTGFAVGDEVLGTMNPLKPGAFAESLVVQAANLVHKPPSLSFEAAACLPIPTMTAWAALVLKARIAAGSRVFVNGCSGAVGSMAVQIARMREARVDGSCSRASMAAARQAGVQTVLDYAEASTWPTDAQYDVVFDTAGLMDVAHGLSMLAPGGLFIDINPSPARVVRGLLGRRYRLVFASQATGALASFADLAARGVLTPTFGPARPLADGVDALTRLEQGQRAGGRVVFAVGDPAGTRRAPERQAADA